MKKLMLVLLAVTTAATCFCQVHTDASIKTTDSMALRIKNLNPYFTIHVDSALKYQLEINKDLSQYYWFLKNSPVGLKINKDNGMLTAKVDKSFFLSGKLEYDHEYKVAITVQNLNNPADKVDTSFGILFYSTEIIASRVKPTVTINLFIEEGDTVSFKIQCDNGSFPIEDISYISNYPIKSITPVAACGDDFTWYAPFDFVKEDDKDKQKKIDLFFIGSNKFHTADTARIEIMVKATINYPSTTTKSRLVSTDTGLFI